MCINQLRANIGGYGLSEDTVGGKGIKYAASVRKEVRSPQSGKIGPAEQPTGIRSKVKVVKNKLADSKCGCGSSFSVLATTNSSLLLHGRLRQA